MIDGLQMNTGGPTEQAYVRENEALRGRISSLESMVNRMREQMRIVLTLAASLCIEI